MTLQAILTAGLTLRPVCFLVDSQPFNKWNEIQSASLANSINWKEWFALPKSTKMCSTTPYTFKVACSAGCTMGERHTNETLNDS